MRHGWTEHCGEWFLGGHDQWLARVGRLSDDVGGGWRAEWMHGYGQPLPTLDEAQEEAEQKIRAYRDRLNAALGYEHVVHCDGCPC